MQVPVETDRDRIRPRRVGGCRRAGAWPRRRSAGGGERRANAGHGRRLRPRRDGSLFRGVVEDGGFGQFMHRREPTAIDKQTVIRMNRDTLYSAAVFDLDAGPVTITLPDAGKRFLSMQVIDEDQYTPEVVYGAGATTLTKDKIGTRYVIVAVRTLVDPADPKDVKAVHALQDAIQVEQPGGPGQFKIPNWDRVEPEKGARRLAGAGVDRCPTRGHVRRRRARSIRCGI